jgi:hypothetical protein
MPYRVFLAYYILSYLWSVHSQPVISLPEVIKDDTRTIM